MTPEEAFFVSDLRHQVIANQNAGLPLHTGIDRDKLKQAVEFCRKDYTANQTKSKASGVSSPSSSPAIENLDALFANVDKKSG